MLGIPLRNPDSLESAVVFPPLPSCVHATLTISANENETSIWNGFILSPIEKIKFENKEEENERKPTLVMRGGNWDTIDLRESIVAVLELADTLGCEKVVVCLPKKKQEQSEDFKKLLRDFMYVGFEVVENFGGLDCAKYVMVGTEV